MRFWKRNLFIAGGLVTMLLVLATSTMVATEIEGTWVGTEPHGYSGELTFLFSENSMYVIDPYEEYIGTFQINTNAFPKQIGFTVIDNSIYDYYNGKISLGIYQLNGDSLQASANEPGVMKIPSTFSEGRYYNLKKTEDRPVSNIFWLAKTIMNEAGGYSREAKIAVGWTVINRLDSKRFGENIEEIVKASNGYAPYWIIPHKEPNLDLIHLAKDLLDREIPDTTQGATHFFSPKSMVSGYGPYKIPGTASRAYIPYWAIPKGSSKENPPSDNWEMTKFYQTIDFPTTEWIGDLENIENWDFMFFRPLSSHDIGNNDNVLPGTSTNTPGFEMIVVFLAVALVLFWKRKSKNL